MSAQTDNVLRLVEQQDIAFIRLWFTDIFGSLKTVMMSLGLAERVCSREESQSRPKQARKDKLAAATAVRLVSLETAQETNSAH